MWHGIIWSDKGCRNSTINSFLHFQVLGLPQKLPTCSRTQNNCSKQANEGLKCYSKRDAVVEAFHWSLGVTRMWQNLWNKRKFCSMKFLLKPYCLILCRRKKLQLWRIVQWNHYRISSTKFLKSFMRLKEKILHIRFTTIFLVYLFDTKIPFTYIHF